MIDYGEDAPYEYERDKRLFKEYRHARWRPV